METKDFITLGISFLALGISLYSTIRYLYMEKFNVEIDFIKWFGANENPDFPFFLWLSIANKSKIPCSITSIDLQVKESRNGMLEAIGDGFSKTVYGSEHRKISSLNYPVNIDGYLGVSGYFHFKSEFPFYYFEECETELIIKTTRGNVKKQIKLSYDNNVFRTLQGEDLSMNKPEYKDLYKNCLSKYYID
ncbi:hypothetical protein [Clostridium tertium]|uniref:hypothetical protein n=1 Tax=Clostridium tertium TaxID=1559 RepID=UPI0018A8DAE1|nr:hypothetical protein [Clostridium tertium]MDB1970737.1 hypothetical protein [Clostridium tertium]